PREHDDGAGGGEGGDRVEKPAAARALVAQIGQSLFVGAGARGETEHHHVVLSHERAHRVPNSRSPASPRPGRMKPRWSRPRSRAAVWMGTSGWVLSMRRTPSGAAMRQRKRMRV